MSYLDFAVKMGLVEQNSAVPYLSFVLLILLKVFQDYDRGKKITDECAAALDRASDSEPTRTDLCEEVMMTVVEGLEKE